MAIVWGVLLLLPRGEARADGVSGIAEPEFSHASTVRTDQAGATSESGAGSFNQSYRLSFERRFLPLLRLSVGASYQRRLGTLLTGTSSEPTDDATTNLFARLWAGGRVLSASGGYDRREESRGLATSSPASTISESLVLHASWRPLDLPTLDARVSRIFLYDLLRERQDLTTTTALLTARYAELKPLDLQYSFRVSQPEDRVSGNVTNEVVHTGRAAYAASFFDKRISSYVSFDTSSRSIQSLASAPDGSVLTQQFPVAGLSVVEAFPTLPEDAVLAPNPALIDGDTASGAGVNIGFSAGQPEDDNLRDVGLQFADLDTPVNTLFVWVDETLPPAVAMAFDWEVYQSEDNATWTPVPLAAQPHFAEFHQRFEVTLEETAARYLKVVVRPLAPSATPYPQYEDIFITELQAFRALPADELRGRMTTSSSTLNVTVRSRLLAGEQLHHDFSLVLTRAYEPVAGTTFFAANGLTYAKKLSPELALNARVARLDYAQGRGHEGAFNYSASLAYRPMRALSHSASYSGSFTQRATGVTISNAWTLFNRAELFRGVSVLANLGYNLGRAQTGQATSGVLANLTASLAPHRTLNLGMSFIASRSTTGALGGLPRQELASERLEGNFSFNPVPAVYLSGGLSSVRVGGEPRVLARAGVSASPFPGGDLQLRFSFNESLDTQSDAVSRQIIPGLRWNIRPGSVLDVGYTFADVSGPVQRTQTRLFSARLSIRV